MSDCKDCDGDGYQEKFNDDQSDVITRICPTCGGSGKVQPHTKIGEGLL